MNYEVQDGGFVKSITILCYPIYNAILSRLPLRLYPSQVYIYFKTVQ